MHALNDLVPPAFKTLQLHHPELALVIPLFAATFITLEVLWYWGKGIKGYDLKESATTIALVIGRFISRGASLAILGPIFLWVYDHRLFHFQMNSMVSFAALFVVVEFFYYWYHRSAHMLRWMWASHSVHHSTTHLNFSAAYRLGWTELFSGDWLFYLAPVFLGFSPFFVVLELTINLLYQFLLHTETVRTLGPLEWVLNTPAHHRAHHAMNESCRDKNFGGILIVFDRMFGTFAAPAKGEKLTYGLAGHAPSLNPFKVAFTEWRAIVQDLAGVRSLRNAWRIAFFGRPAGSTSP